MAKTNKHHEMTMDVRLAEGSDLSFVSQDGYLTTDLVAAKIERGEVFVAERGALPVGYLRLEFLWSIHPYISLIRVLPDHRRRGVGKALLAAVEDFLRARGHAFLLSSSQVDEPESQAWHRHVGFQDCGSIEGLNDGGVGELFFRKEL